MSALALAISLLAVGRAAGQAGATPSDAPPDYSSEAFVVEDDSTHVSFENDGTSVREESFRVRIQSDVGLQRYGVLTLAYQGSAESVEIDYVRVRKPDGSVITTPSESIQDMPAAITREAPFYSDLREKHVSVKGLGVGDVLESHAVWRLTKPLVPGQFWVSFNTSLDFIVLNYQVRVSVPRDRGLKWSSEGVKPVITDEGSRRVFTWTTSQLKRKASGEDEGKADKERTAEQAAHGKIAHPDVEMSSFQSWEAVGEWYRSLIRDLAQPSPEIRAKAAELTRNAATEDAKIRAIYNYVSTQIRYIGVAFGIGRYKPHAAAEVLSNQYGDCKDKSTLLTAMLSAVGVKASSALINSSRQIDEAVPSPGQFDHVITTVARGDGHVWLDTTTEVAPFGYLISTLRDKRALVIAPDRAPVLVTTNPDPPRPALQTYRMEATLGDTGTLEGTADWSVKGDDTEVILRAAFRKTPMPQWKDIVQLISYRSGFGGEVTDVRVDSTLDTEQPLRWTFKYTRKDYSDWANRRITPPLPLIALSHTDDKPGDSVPLGGPGELHFEASLRLPPGSAPRLPPRRELKETFADYSATYEFKDGILRADRRLVAKKREIPAAEYEAYQKFAKAVQDDNGFFINLVARPRITPWSYQDAIWDLPYSENPEASRAYDDARADYEKRDPDGEIASLKKAVAIDTKFTRAWLWLGEIYKSERKETLALETYRSAIKGNPQEPLSYKVLAFNQLILRRFDDAIVTWRQLIGATSEDPEAFAGLGSTLVAANRQSEAIAPLETATRLDPTRGELFVQLGLAHLKGGHEAQAVDALRRGIEVDPQPISLNNAAYALAEANKQLPLALEYSEKAMRAEEDASAKSTLAELTMKDLGHAVSLHMYWDTLGWVHAQMGHLDRAEKYLRAAWTLSQSAVEGEHLGRVYERQHRPDEAIRMYQLALASTRADEQTKDTRKRLDQALTRLGAGAGVKTTGEELTRLRTAKLQQVTSETTSAEYFLLVGAGPKVLDSKFISGDAALKKADKAVKAATVSMLFPDNGPTRVVRRGLVSCSSMSGCSIVLYAPDLVRSLN